MTSWKNLRCRDAKMRGCRVLAKGPMPVNSVSSFLFPIHSHAFTLAEVLITLGIIGVIAAMTIPSLMNQIQDRQLKEAAKAAYSKASQAVQQMKLDEGGSLNSYFGANGTSFQPAFIKYFKIAQDCGLSNCVNTAIYTSLTGDTTDTSKINMGQFITTDGMFWGIGNWSSPPLYITVDVNGYGKGPNIYGRDVFMFQISNNNNVLPMGADNTALSAPGFCNRASHSSAQGLACMNYVMQGIDY